MSLTSRVTHAFTHAHDPPLVRSYEVVTEDGLMRPVLAAKKGGLYCGGSARMVEKALGVSRTARCTVLHGATPSRSFAMPC